MQRFPDQQFEVKWWPFQLNAQASKQGVNKLQMYCEKFGGTPEQMMQKAEGMKQNFARAGLPFKFTDQAITGNTFNSHRLISMAGSVSEETQDKVVESLFNAYFAEEKFLNDPEVLIASAIDGGIPADTARAFVQDESQHSEQTDREMGYGKQQRVTGVPHFVIEHNGKRASLSGAQPSEAFEQLFQQMSS